MIDLAKRQKPYEIKLEDGTILKIRRPSQRLLLELTKLQDYSGQPVELIEAVSALILEIFNNNMNGRKFTEDEINSMVDFELSMYILQDYLEETVKNLGE